MAWPTEYHYKNTTCIQHASIFEFLEHLDLVVLHSTKPIGNFKYLGSHFQWLPSLPEYVLQYSEARPNYVLHTRHRTTCLYDIFCFANENRIARIGFVPFGDGNYERIYRQLRDCRLEYRD